MGELKVDTNVTDAQRTQFIRHLLDDIAALDIMLKENMIEKGITRIGSEQEFCLVDENWRPSMNATSILKSIDDAHFTTELAKFNLEINLDPLELANNCFSVMDNQLRTLLRKARNAAEKFNNKVVLTGILPSISRSELKLEYLTPRPRYHALNQMVKKMRGSDFELHIRGVDELRLQHDSILFEACNTSFQMHLQIDPDDFISSYNWSQAIAGPLLAISTNSPLLLGKELWSETRIALFQQSIDTRISTHTLRDQQARVTFGDSWAEGSIANIYQNEISRYKILLTKDIERSSLDELKEGKIPKLKALSLHNGTIYRWNRACYGVGGGKPHVRIENRYIPSGPTILDEMAIFVFWVGLMKGRPQRFDDIASVMNFREAKSNFFKAARLGKESVMSWLGEQISIPDLIQNTLLPIARSGLEKCNVSSKDIDRYLEIVEQKTSGYSGSQWITSNYRTLTDHLKKDDALLALTKSIYDNQWDEIPQSQWPSCKPSLNKSATKVSHIMSTNLFTVNENDLAELAVKIMKWKDIHHVPVENNTGNLTGLLTWSHLEKYDRNWQKDKISLVSDLMIKDVYHAHPFTEIAAAIKTMNDLAIGCLPVVDDHQLVGIITLKDIANL